MKKILITSVVLILSGIIIFLLLTNNKKTVSDYNLLIITLDTTRADRIGAYGNPGIDTKNIDKLAREGIMFKNCYSPVPLTLPAHCSIFTGKYPIGHGVRNNGKYKLNSSEITLAKLFKQKGYYNFSVIAAYVLLSKFGLNTGFDYYDDSLDDNNMINNFKSEITADLVYDKFKNWFNRNYNKKFFSWVHFYDPHKPYLIRDKSVNPNELDMMKVYDSEIEFVDEYIGRIIQDLEETGTLDNTLIVIVGDHGEAFGEHKEFGHSIFCYQENLMVPLIFYNKNILPKPRQVNSRVSLVDVMPTILELYQQEIPTSVQGISLMPLLKGKENKQDRLIYFESVYGKEEMNWSPLIGMIDNQYKYISLPIPELYDLAKDKGEKENIFKKRLDIAKAMDKKLGEVVVSFSEQNKNSKQQMSKKDVAMLKSLGYVSSFSGQAKTTVDPKIGVEFDARLKELSKMVSNKENIAEAEAEIKQIIEEKPDLVNHAIYNMLYIIQQARGDETAAIEVLEQGIQRFPEADNLKLNLARKLFGMENYTRVVSLCESILKNDPYNSRAYILLADIHIKQGNGADAIYNFRKAVEIEPENITLKKQLGDLLLKAKYYEDAAQLFNDIMDKRDNIRDHRFLFQVATLNIRVGLLGKAETVLARAIQVQPKGKYYYYYALVLSRTNKLHQALRNMEIVLKDYYNEISPEIREKARQAVNAWQKKLN